jgi:hypothetical protein
MCILVVVGVAHANALRPRRAGILPAIARHAQRRMDLLLFALRIFTHTTLSRSGGNGMTTSTIDESQRKAARVAGFFYLLTFAIVVAVNFGINERLMIAGNPAQTARNILAHERLFRIGIASNLVYEAGLLVLLSALYVTLRPAGRTLALLAAFWRLVYASMWVLMSLNQLTALRLLNGTDYLRVLGTEQAQTLGRLYLSGFDAYYVGLLFYGLASTACSHLFFKSGYLPRGLAAFGVIVSAWAASCTLAFIISPDFAKHVNLWWFDTGLGLFELATGFWLVIKGLRPETTTADRARAGVTA